MTVGPTTSGWHVALRTEAGRRDGNQDSVLSMRRTDGSLVVAVADGMGGLEMGDVASRVALEVLRNEVTRGTGLAEAVRAANRAVHERAAGRPMGTTLVAAQAEGNRVTIVNVGDSRAYRLTPLGVSQITVDHTHAEEARRGGEGAQGAEAVGRWANALTRSLGAGSEVEVDVFGPLELDEAEALLLCSDGVHGVLPGPRIEEWSHALDDPERAVERLIEVALAHGSADNLSAVLLLRLAAAAPPAAAIRRRAPAWDPRVLMERSPVGIRKRSGGRTRLFGLATLLVIAALAAAWFITR